jgi:transcription initiation factor IIE alpha subunit
VTIQIVANGVTTTALRDLLAALAENGLAKTATVGLEGPELWTVTTPMLTPSQYAAVFGRLVKHQGEAVTDVLRRHRDSRDAVMGQ